MLLRVLLPLLLIDIVISQSIITSLPGFHGDLPFKLETGYIGVGDLDDVQLFYYFIESERNPKVDPLFFWLTGGPGCSGLSALIYEIGPFTFDYEKSIGNKPQLTLNPYSWTKVANIIFLDTPAGTGFSYANSWQSYILDDSIQAAQLYTFIKKWFKAHPNFLTNTLYVGGDSYAGKMVPMVAVEISNGNEIGDEPPLNLQGITLGNALTDVNSDKNSRVEYAHRLALISDELYESLKINCKGEYVDVDPSNLLCINALQNYTECTAKLNTANILEPSCGSLSPRPINGLGWDFSTIIEDTEKVLLKTKLPEPWCRTHNYVYIYIWANDKMVQEALHVREGTVRDWVRCNQTLLTGYTQNIPSVLSYHQELIKRGYRALVYSGDHDMAIPYVGTITWIRALKLTLENEWLPWFVNGQIAGYTFKYKHKDYRLTYATVKGAGHTAPEFNPMQCLAMIDRWIANYPL